MEELEKDAVVNAEEAGIVEQDGPVVDAEVIDETPVEEDYKYEPLTDEQRKTLSKDEQDIYDSAVMMQDNPEVDIFSFWKENNMCKDLLDSIKHSPDNEKKDMKEAAKDIVDMQAAQIALNLEYKKMQDAIKTAMPEEFAKAYFHNNDIMYGVIPDDNGKIHELKNPEVTEVYLKALDIKDILAMLDDPKFVRKAKKDSNKDVRFQRHVDRVNLYLNQYYRNRNLTSKSPIVNCANTIPHMIKAFDLTPQQARVYYIALSELTKTWEPYNLLNAEFIYLCNMNAIVACAVDKEESEPAASEAKFFNNIKLFFDKVKQMDL